MTAPNGGQIEFWDDPVAGAYVVSVDGRTAGKTEYLMRDGRHVFVHTEVDDEHSGAGLGADLVRYALEDIRSKGGLVVPICPFVSAYIGRHREYDDLVDRQMTMRLKARKK